MPERPNAHPEQFIQGTPVLRVPDVKATAAWYRDMLGFHWHFGDEGYAVVWRDNSAIHFAQGEAPADGLRLFQWVRDVDALHGEVAGRGAPVTVPPGPGTGADPLPPA